MANSIPSASNPTPTWVNITSNIHNIAFSIFGQTYDPTTDPNSVKLNQAVALSTVVADWQYTIPNASNDPAGPGFHPVLYVAANSGVFQSLDDGLTWTLFPDSALGAEAEGGNLPHVAVTDLSLSIGNINSDTGMPNLAGPYDPSSPKATPDPDLMLASTFGRGSFAINLGPIVFPGTTQIAQSDLGGTAADGSQIVTSATPNFSGLSEITGFGNATRITIVDETPGDVGKVIGGFDTANVNGTNIAANWTDAFGNFSVSVKPGAFTSNGLKTVEVFATDDAGSTGNAIKFTFTLQATITAPSAPPATPTLAPAPFDVTGAPGFTNVASPSFIGVTSPGVNVELLQANGSSFNPPVTTTSDPVTGQFTLTFPNPTSQSGTFTVEADATNKQGTSPDSLPVSFTIILNKPNSPSSFRLSPADDTGIKAVGTTPSDNITSNRTPHFIGQTVAGATVELFEVGKTTVWDKVVADGGGNFAVQLPFSLGNGQISLFVEAIDQAGNTSAPSNTLTVTTASVLSDYNGDSFSDAAVFRRDTTDSAGLWFVQATQPSGSNTPPPAIWFASGKAFGPANSVPFQGDFDGDGVTDLAYYSPSTATWFMDDSTAGLSSFALGTANSSLPVVGYFNVNGPEQAAVFTIVNGQGIWSFASATMSPVTFGVAGDIPVPGDYTGVGFDELAVYRPTTGQFLVLVPGAGGTTTTDTISIPGIGPGTADLSSLEPVPANYNPFFNASLPTPAWVENTEAAVFDPKTGVFTILGPNGAVDMPIPTFLPGDIPAPADYLGIGSIQPAVFRPSTGQFIEAGGVVATAGQSGDIPLAAPLPYRMPSTDGTTTDSSGSGTTGSGTGTSGSGTTSSGTGTTGSGTGTTGTGTTGTGAGATGSGSTGSGTQGTGTTPVTPPAQGTTSPSHPKKASHKKPPKPKHHPKPKPAHHKKPQHVKPKKAEHAAKPKVHVVQKVKVVMPSAAHHAKAKPAVHAVDLALEDIHVNLRRGSAGKGHKS